MPQDINPVLFTKQDARKPNASLLAQEMQRRLGQLSAAWKRSAHEAQIASLRHGDLS